MFHFVLPLILNQLQNAVAIGLRAYALGLAFAVRGSLGAKLQYAHPRGSRGSVYRAMQGLGMRNLVSRSALP